MLTIDYISLEKGAEPLQIVERDHYSGIVTEVVQRCAKDRYQLNYAKLPLERFRQFFAQKIPQRWLHMGAHQWSDDPGRWTFSKTPIFRASYSLVSNKKLPISSIEECRGQRVIFIHGIRFNGLEEQLKRLNIEVVYVSNHQEGLLALEKDRGLAFIEMDHRIRFALTKMQRKPEDFVFVKASTHAPDYDIFLSFGLAFTEEERGHFDRCLAEMKQSGELEKIIQHYQ